MNIAPIPTQAATLPGLFPQPAYSDTLVQNWLRNQTNDSTGLIISYDAPGDNRAITKDQFLAILDLIWKYMELGKTADSLGAQKIMEAMLDLQDSTGYWNDVYNVLDGQPTNYDKRTGTAGLGAHVLNIYYEITQDIRALDAAIEAANWLLNYRDLNPNNPTFKAVKSGEWARPGNVYTKENAIIIACLYGLSENVNDSLKTVYQDAVRGAADWLVNKTWWQIPEYKRFEVGTDTLGNLLLFNEYDFSINQYLTLLALDATKSLTGYDPSDYDGLLWVSQYEIRVFYGADTLWGFSIVTLERKPDSMAFNAERTPGYALASKVIFNDTASYNKFYGEVKKVQTSDGGVLDLVGNDSTLGWPYNYPYPSVAAAVWFDFAGAGINLLKKDDVTPVKEGPQPLPVKPGIIQSLDNYPNPFNNGTTIRYELNRIIKSGVEIKIYNILGQEVRTINNAPANMGINELYWNGEDNNGNRVASSIYSARLLAGPHSQTIKLTLLR